MTDASSSEKELSAPQRLLLTRLLEQMLELGGGVPSWKFRAENYDSVSILDELSSSGLLKLENETYVVQSTALPLIDSDAAQRLLSSIELIYAALAAQYKETHRASVPVSTLAAATGLSRSEAAATLRVMLDTNLWNAGNSTDLLVDDAFVTPSEDILKYSDYAQLTKQVRSWAAERSAPRSFASEVAHFREGTNTSAKDVDQIAQAGRVAQVAPSRDNLLDAWPAARACLEKFNFGDIKTVAGLAGFHVTTASHLVQKADGGATKGQLLTAVDQEVGAMDTKQLSRFLNNLIEEILRRRPEMLEQLSEFLGRLGWSFSGGTLVALELFDVNGLGDIPVVAHQDLLKAAQRLRIGDLSGAITSACAAVDAATAAVYEEFNLGDPTKAKSFQEKCSRATHAKGVLVDLELQLQAIGWQQNDVGMFTRNLGGALNQGAYVLQTLRSHMGDVHGTKPIVRSLVFDCLRWAQLIVGALVAQPDDQPGA